MRRCRNSIELASLALTIFLSVSLFCASNAQAGVKLCRDLFHQGPVMGGEAKSFKPTTTYTKEVTGEQALENQCGMNTCHVYSWLSGIEQRYASEHGKPIKLSSHFFTAKLWLDRAFEALEADGDRVSISLGDNVLDSRDTFVHQGVIPDQAWTGARDFNMQPRIGRLGQYLTTIITRARIERAKVDKTLNGDPRLKNRINTQAKRDIRKLIEGYTGKIPATFEFEGREFTPQTFAKEFFPELQKPLVQVNISVFDKLPPSKWPQENGRTLYMANLKTVEDIIRQNIDLGETVYLVYQHEDAYIDASTGIMSPSAFNIPKSARPLPRNDRMDYGQASAGHLVRIVGYDLDPRTNRIVKFKIRNTWGESAGDHGYYHMYADYFRLFAVGATFFDDARLKLPENPTLMKSLAK